MLGFFVKVYKIKEFYSHTLLVEKCMVQVSDKCNVTHMQHACETRVACTRNAMQCRDMRGEVCIALMSTYIGINVYSCCKHLIMFNITSTLTYIV